ncbi:MAG: hypothetical protein H6825_02005 [Planctomycetes bacterium]|nr:hypothetical protein [Planctomycetota bacterium]
MRSMRRRLVLGAMLGITLFLAAGGAALYVAVRDRLVLEVDRGLDTVANATAESIVFQLVRREHQGVPRDFDEYPLTDPTRRSDVLYEARLSDGTVARSEELGDTGLPEHASVGDAVEHYDVTLPDGRPARAAALHVDFRADRPPEPPFRLPRRALRELMGPDGERPPWPPPRDDWDRLPFDDEPRDGRDGSDTDAARDSREAGAGAEADAAPGASAEADPEADPEADSEAGPEADAGRDPDAEADADFGRGRGRRRGERQGERGAESAELVVAQDVDSVTSTLRHLRRMLALAWLMSATGCALIVVWVVHGGLRPLVALRTQIGEVDATRLDRRIELPGAPVELAPVVDQLNGLMERLRDAFAREQAFTDHAAHELRTPLAGLRATLEVALLRKRSPEDYAASARQCLEIVVLMHGMVETLLDLSRAGPAGRAPELVDVDALLRRAFGPYEDAARAVDLEFVPDVADDARQARVDVPLVERVLGNLLQNAVAHGDPGGTLAVRAARTASGALRVEVSNPAAQVTSDDAARAFDAFWRADASRTGTGGHAGLGLTLCQRIVERLGGTIAARAGDGRFTVTVELPEA